MFVTCTHTPVTHKCSVGYSGVCTSPAHNIQSESLFIHCLHELIFAMSSISFVHTLCCSTTTQKHHHELLTTFSPLLLHVSCTSFPCVLVDTTQKLSSLFWLARQRVLQRPIRAIRKKKVPKMKLWAKDLTAAKGHHVECASKTSWLMRRSRQQAYSLKRKKRK